MIVFYHSYSTYSGILELIFYTILISDYADYYKKKSIMEYSIDFLSTILIFRAMLISNNNTAIGILFIILLIYIFTFLLKKNFLFRNYFFSIFLILFGTIFISYILIFYSGFFIKFFQIDGLWSRFLLFQIFASIDLKEFIFPVLNVNLINNELSFSFHNSYIEIILYLSPLIFILILIFLKKIFVKEIFEKYTFL